MIITWRGDRGIFRDMQGLGRAASPQKEWFAEIRGGLLCGVLIIRIL